MYVTHSIKLLPIGKSCYLFHFSPKCLTFMGGYTSFICNLKVICQQLKMCIYSKAQHRQNMRLGKQVIKDLCDIPDGRSEGGSVVVICLVVLIIVVGAGFCVVVVVVFTNTGVVSPCPGIILGVVCSALL